MQAKLKNIVIVGGGTAGWMTAAAISKVVGCQTHNVTLIESEQIGTVGVGEATIPMISFYNKVLGLDENEFMRATNATFKLGIEFVGWRNHESSYFHPFGLLGVDMEGIPFAHYWARWKSLGGNLSYAKFNAETEAAIARKFARTAHETGPKVMPDINYAFQFDASLYAAYLRNYSEKRGVVRQEGKIVHVLKNPNTGFIEKVVMDDGREIAGDFFIDCSGFRGLLISEALEVGYEDWSHWLPVNRAAAVPCESAGELLPFTRATAREAGWQWRIPLQHRTGNGYVYCNSFIDEDAAANLLLQRLDGKALAEPRTLRFITGMRKKCWEKNCLAIGLSSGFLEPLESTSIHLVQIAISKLLAMFPRDEFNVKLINRFNNEMSVEYGTIKDFLIAHYKITDREDTEFWRYVKNMAIPESLQERLHVFKTRGEALVSPQELFKEPSWFCVLVGQGLIPQSYHVVADSLPENELRMRLTKIRAGIQNRINSMPTHAEYIRNNCMSPMSKII